MAKRITGFADFGLIAIISALCLIIGAGLIMWHRASEANRANQQRVHDVVKVNPN